MPWQSFANRGVAREVRIQAWSPVTIPAIFDRGPVCVSPLLSSAGTYQFAPRRSHPLDPRQIINHTHLAVLFLDECRAGFHPIAAVVIGDGAKLPDRGAVDVATENSIDRKLLRVTNNLFFVSANETDCVLDSFFCIGTERPITETESAAHQVDRRVEREQELVAKVTCKGEPLHVLHHGVELVPMNHEHAAAVGQTMNGMFLHRDVAIGAIKFGEQIIVIARNINGPRAFTRFTQDFLNDVVVLLWPVNPTPQLPDVDQVTHDVERFEFVFTQEIEQCASVRAARPEMHVRNPRRSHATDGIWFSPKRALNRKSRCA